MLGFLVVTEVDDPEGARPLIAQVLTTYATRLEGRQKLVAMAMLLPSLLARAKGDGQKCFKETSSRVLALAASDQVAFKAVVSGLSAEQRSLMESILRSGRQEGQVMKLDSDEEDQEPTIALRMDFGS